MTSSRVVFVSTAICLFLAYTCEYGCAYEDPYLGAAGAAAGGAVAGAQEEEGHDGAVGGAQEEEGHDGAVGGAQEEEGHDPEYGFDKALECFSDGYIYKDCEEAYRVSEKGEVVVPHEYTDQFCDGPCLRENGLVLDCVEQIFKHFRFHNKATIKDVRKALHTGCTYGPKRGNFDVAKHIGIGEEDSAAKFSSSLLYATALMIMGWRLLF